MGDVGSASLVVSSTESGSNGGCLNRRKDMLMKLQEFTCKSDIEISSQTDRSVYSYDIGADSGAWSFLALFKERRDLPLRNVTSF